MQQPENETQIGPYKIIDRIGQGGTSVVYRATDTRNNQNVALKVLTPLFATDPKFLRRFINEGKNVKLLDHPHIVSVYDASEADDRQFIAMELIEGGSLSSLVKTREHILPIDETLAIIRQIADALDYAHSMGILHRDIKLSNILITSDGRYVLSDFGSAKQMSMENTVVTQSGFSVGTPTFMSPEQAKGDPNIDRRTDVYSLGVAAYALLVGKLPFQADSQVALLHKIIYDAPPSPETINPTIPPGIAYALKRVLCKEPQMRYSTAGEFADALVEGKTWIPGTMDYEAIPSQYLTRSVQIEAANRQINESSGKRGWLKPLSLIGLLLLGSVLAFAFLNRDRGDTNAAIVGSPTSVTSTTVESQESLDAIGDDSSNAGIAEDIAELEAGNFVTVSDEQERFQFVVPDGWIQMSNGNTTTSDAQNFVGRLFVHKFDGSDTINDPRTILEEYRKKTEQDGTYENLKVIGGEETIQVSGQDAYQEIITGVWLGAEVEMRLFSLTNDSSDRYIVGSIVATDQSEQTQPFMDKLVGQFVLNEGSPDLIASLGDANEASTDAEIVSAQNTNNVDTSTMSTSQENQPNNVEDTQNEADNSSGIEPQFGVTSTVAMANTGTGGSSISTSQGEQLDNAEDTQNEDDNPSAVEPQSDVTGAVAMTDTDASVNTEGSLSAVLTVGEILSASAGENQNGIEGTDENAVVSTSPSDTPLETGASSPTALLEPPTATDVPATDTPEPPTATDVPATDTPEPPTATDVPATDTPEPPTATDVPATDTPEPPTATFTAVPPTSTATSVPPTPTFIPLPPPTVYVPPPTVYVPPPTVYVPPPTPTLAPVPTRPFLFPPGSFRIVKPDVFDTDSGRTYFEWTSLVVPAPGQAYELVFWKEGQDLLTQAFGVAEPTLSNQLTVDLEIQDRVLGELLEPGRYNWTVLLVNQSPYERLQILGDIRELVVVRK